MKKSPLFLLVAIALANLLTVPHAAVAKPAEPAASSPAAVVADTPPSPEAKDTGDADDAQSENTLVSIGHDSTLAAGDHAAAVISVLGSSTSAGDVDHAVVSVLGDTRVTGPVGDAAVAVLGSTYVDSHVGHEVVAVLGNVELGPHAEVGGDVVAVGGVLKRDPGAIIHGSVQNVMLFGTMEGFEGLRSWVKHCLLFGRPLAFAPHLGWAWTLAFSFLALYLLIALVFPAAVNRCVHTMEAYPGRTALASLLTFLLKPIVFLLLVVTVIGAILVPFLAFAVCIAGVFGKVVALAWIGRRVIPNRDPEHRPLPVLAVLVGGLVMLLLYVVPVFGFIAYWALGMLGLGIVVYTLLLGFRASRAAAGAEPPAMPAAPMTPAASAGSPDGTEPPATEAPPAGAAAMAGAPEQTQGAAAPTAPPPAPPISMALADRAGFWHRAVALLLDFILVGIMCSIVGLHSHGVLLLLAAYGAVMWKLRGTTIGGIVCNLRVVRLDGRPIDWPTAIVRALGCFLSAAVAGLGFIWVVFDPERQSWHDKIAGTVVVRTPRGTALL